MVFGFPKSPQHVAEVVAGGPEEEGGKRGEAPQLLLLAHLPQVPDAAARRPADAVQFKRDPLEEVEEVEELTI